MATKPFIPPDKTKRYAVVERPTAGPQKDAITKVFQQDLHYDDAFKLKDKIAATRQSKYAVIIEMPSHEHVSEVVKSEDMQASATTEAPPTVASSAPTAAEIVAPTHPNGLKVVDSFTVVDGKVTRVDTPTAAESDDIEQLLAESDDEFDTSDVAPER